MISKIRQKISKTRQKRPVYKAYGPNRLADNFTNTTLCERKHAASKRKTDAVGHRSEHPGKSGSCRMRNNPFRIFLGGGGLTKHVRAQGGPLCREREEIVRAPRGKLRPEAGDRPTQKSSGALSSLRRRRAGRNMMRCVLTVVCGAVCRSGRHSERKPARGTQEAIGCDEHPWKNKLEPLFLSPPPLDFLLFLESLHIGQIQQRVDNS